MISPENWIYIFIGMVGMMMLFTAMQFYLLKTRIYGYYVLYMLCWLVYFVAKQLINLDETAYEFTRVAPAMLAYLMYYQFANLFIDMQKNSPAVYRMFVFTSYILLVYVGVDFVLCFVFKAFKIHEILHYIVRFYMIGVSFYGIYKLYNLKNTLILYFITGSLLVVAGSTLAMILTILPYESKQFYEEPIFSMQIGILAELLCFSLGLAYKQRLIEKEKILIEQSMMEQSQRYEIEKLQAVLETQQQERTRVASELHDDIGSGLSSIRFLSEKVLAKMPDLTDLKKVSEKARELVENMREIVWMMSDNNSTLDDLILYLRKYSFQYLEENNIRLSFKSPDYMDDAYLTNDQKRNIFLSLKECLHNIIKHSQADKVIIEVTNNDLLKIAIADNGVGIKEDLMNNFGNGLKNMQKRMKFIKSDLEISNNSGTKVTFLINLHEK